MVILHIAFCKISVLFFLESQLIILGNSSILSTGFIFHLLYGDGYKTQLQIFKSTSAFGPNLPFARLGHAAVQPVIADFRRNRKIS
ncbi:hypothetical protein RC74_03205 [Falsihalocynthiibacter arcticus]|uniref:Uncharacterized protein n=1 Tax=Falsihalocynthiibacter arcticus TaxID=1579316 RepID=A0A126UWG7_9RHOB|nr:hypothetical protein RC74_03205 [Falsihalocynthiibacter arcticus]